MPHDATKPLPESEIRELVRRAQKGDVAARNRVVTANLRIVNRLAFEASKRCHSMTSEDLVSEGALGLMHAVTKYDPASGVKFLTYAVHWIRAYLGKAVTNTDEMVRIPANRRHQVHTVHTAAAAHEARTGEAPSDAQLVAATKLSPARVRAARPIVRCRPTSLNQPVGDLEAGETLIGQIPNDEDAPTLDEQIDTSREVRRGRAILNRLSSIERETLLARFEGDTLEQVGQRYGITREAVRIRQNKAMAHAVHIAGAE